MIANHSILVQVRGQDPNLKPYMLCAHLDVVPVDDKLWTHPPFDGYMDDVFVWGRGALDDKHSLMVGNGGAIEPPLRAVAFPSAFARVGQRMPPEYVGQCCGICYRIENNNSCLCKYTVNLLGHVGSVGPSNTA